MVPNGWSFGQSASAVSGSATIERIFSRIISATISLEARLHQESLKTPRISNSSPASQAASKRVRRTSSVAVAPLISVTSSGTPPRDRLAASR